MVGESAGAQGGRTGFAIASGDPKRDWRKSPEARTGDEPDFKRRRHTVHSKPEMSSVSPTESETGMWFKKVEFELDRFIFVAPKPIPEEEWTKLCEQFGGYQTQVLLGDALLIDLRGKEPRFVSVPADYKPPEVVT